MWFTLSRELRFESLAAEMSFPSPLEVAIESVMDWAMANISHCQSRQSSTLQPREVAYQARSNEIIISSNTFQHLEFDNNASNDSKDGHGEAKPDEDVNQRRKVGVANNPTRHDGVADAKRTASSTTVKRKERRTMRYTFRYQAILMNEMGRSRAPQRIVKPD